MEPCASSGVWGSKTVRRKEAPAEMVEGTLKRQLNKLVTIERYRNLGANLGLVDLLMDLPMTSKLPIMNMIITNYIL